MIDLENLATASGFVAIILMAWALLFVLLGLSFSVHLFVAGLAAFFVFSISAVLDIVISIWRD